jgi:hypothetical protein
MAFASASRFSDEIISTALLKVSAFVFVSAVPGSVVMITVIGVVTVARIAVVSQPKGVTGSVIITGIIKPRVKRTGIIIIVAIISLIITISRYPFPGDTSVEAVIPSLLVFIIGFEAGRIFFKEVGIIACGKTTAITTLHKTHLVGGGLLYADHGVRLIYSGGLQRRWPLISGLIPTLIMGITS